MMMKEKVIKIMVPAYVTAMYPNTLGRSTGPPSSKKGENSKRKPKPEVAMAKW